MKINKTTFDHQGHRYDKHYYQLKLIEAQWNQKIILPMLGASFAIELLLVMGVCYVNWEPLWIYALFIALMNGMALLFFIFLLIYAHYGIDYLETILSTMF